MVYLGIFKIRLICLIFSVVGDEVLGVRMGKHKCLCMVVNLFPDVHRYAFGDEVCGVRLGKHKCLCMVVSLFPDVHRYAFLEWTFRYVIFCFLFYQFFFFFSFLG